MTELCGARRAGSFVDEENKTEGTMDSKNPLILARLSTALLLALAPACGSGSSNGPSGGGAGTGMGN